VIAGVHVSVELEWKASADVVLFQKESPSGCLLIFFCLKKKKNF